MEGKNTLVISSAEMTRAVNHYFKELTTLDGRGDSIVISVRQKGAKVESPFIIEIDDKFAPSKAKK
jgi:hypothetical protein